MKRILVLLIVVALAITFSFAGCTAQAPAEEAAEAPAEEPAAEEPAAEEPAAEEPAAEEPAAEEPAAEVQTLDIGFYADGADSYYQVMVDTMQACADADPETEWTIDYKVGQNTAAEQLQAVEDFITAGYDAIVVIQNSADTTSECITKCQAAGIPYFGAAHSFASAPNATDAAGSCCYNFVEAGVYAGEDALARGVKKVINIEGQLGQGSAGAQTLGFLKAYEDAGMSLGGPTAEEVATKKTEASLDGTQDIEVVFWASGGWFSDPAQKAMTDAITSLGVDGFDGAYVQNDPMMEGVLMAMEEAGLNSSDYWLGASNGREISWQWVKDGVITMDVNQTAALEGDTLYQQVKAHFNGDEYRKYIHPYLTPYNVDNINDVALVPFSDVDAYMAGREAGDFVTDINDPKFVDQEGF
ncbi:MAG: sugar ABC transporter substrate-binding protein [Actinomycetota bacterium]|nr:sugar ABC transporter substrate-binding protein [Actinomycetota bacterium]